MLYLTKNSIRFGITAGVLSVIFPYCLYNVALAKSNYGSILWYASAYGISMLGAGFFFGYFDDERKHRYDLGLLYHATTYFMVNFVHTACVLTMAGGKYFTWQSTFCQFLFWGLGLLLHWHLSKREIKGIRKEDIFV